MKMRRVKRVGRPNFTQNYEPPVARPVVNRSLSSRLRLIVWLVTAVIIIVGLLAAGRITQVKVVGTTQAAAVRAQALDIMNHPLSHRFIYWFSGPSLAGTLIEKDASSIASVTVSTNLISRSITIKVEERQPVLAWQSNNHTYLVDQKGVATALIGNQSVANFPLVVDQTNLDVIIGKPVAPDSFVNFVRDVQKELPQVLQLDYKQGRVVDTTNELYVDTTGGFYIRFDTTRSVDDQLAEVKALLSNNIHPSQYVDVRLAYKAYYK